MTALLMASAYSLRARTHEAVDYEWFMAVTGIDLSEVTWEAPSDVLLDVPGRELLRTVPIIDVPRPAITPDSARSPNDSQRRSGS
jgi:hypothetical protein